MASKPDSSFRNAQRFVWLGNIAQDLRVGYRGLLRRPLFTTVVVATLALGIGATSALFAVVDSAILRALPGTEPDRLVWLQEFSTQREESGGTPLRFADWQHARSFIAMCGMYSDQAVIDSEQGPVRLRILHTIGDPYKTLGIPLLRGRAFTSAENRGEGQPAALITSGAWRNIFGGDPNILKRTLRLGRSEIQIVGVLDADPTRQAVFPEKADVWTPAAADLAHIPRQAGFLSQVGRLAPGASLKTAQAEINLVTSQLAASYPETDKDRSATLIPLQEFVSKSARKPLLTLLAAAGAVLLIACVNIAGLLIARGLARQREAAIRISVGAGFLRLVRLFFAESLLLAAGGCLLGLAIAKLGIGILKRMLPPDIPHLATLGLNWRVTACAIGVAAVSALLFGGLPAWQFADSGQGASLKSSGRSRVRAGLVVLEVALSLVLLVTAELLATSFFHMRDQPSGFNPTSVYTFSVPFGWGSDPSALNSFAAGALQRLTTSPGTVSAGVVDQLPLHGGSQSGRLLVQGMDLSPALALKEFSWRTASSGYFATAGIPLKTGSLFRDWIAGKGDREIVITDRLAAILFPGGDALGHSIASAPRGNDVSKTPQWFRITGVVGSVKLSPTDDATEAGVYVPWGATYWPGMSFVVKSSQTLGDFSRLVRRQVQPLTKAQIVEKIDTLDAATAETRSDERVRTTLLASFAGAALALSAIGLFGTLSQEVAKRTRDYGVRLALGAEPRSIAWSAVRLALTLAVLGVVVGVAASVWATQFLRGLLFGIEASDVSAYLIAATVLLATATLAALVPALKAARIDPISTLRHE